MPGSSMLRQLTQLITSSCLEGKEMLYCVVNALAVRFSLFISSSESFIVLYSVFFILKSVSYSFH